jgi:hypothetical protein
MVNKKNILIILSVIIIVAFIGTIVCFYLKNPELLTKSPSEVILGEAEQDHISLKPDTKDRFIVNDSLWNSATIYHRSYPDGSEEAGVQFADVPIGTKIYAPFDGYAYVYSMQEEDILVNIIVLSNQNNWDWPDELALGEQTLIFAAHKFKTFETEPENAEELGIEYNFKIKNGSVLAEVLENGEMIDGARLIIEPHLKPIDPSITDAKGYFIKTIK